VSKARFRKPMSIKKAKLPRRAGQFEALGKSPP